MKTFKELLIELDACEEAVDWAEDKTVEEVVEQCHRGDWLLWLADRVDIGLQPLTLAEGQCANTVRHLMTDERIRVAIDASIAFGEGRVAKDDLNRTGYASAAAWAAHVAYTAAETAAAAAYTAYGNHVARKENQALTADICRQYIGDLIIEKVNENLK